MHYFSGANVKVEIKKSISETTETWQELDECAGLSYSVSNSQQPVYGYGSHRFDAMLPGREIIQGNLLVNYTKPNYFVDKFQNFSKTDLKQKQISFNSFLTFAFDLKITFLHAEENCLFIEDCYIISKGQSIQITDQVILDEFSFIARSISYKDKV